MCYSRPRPLPATHPDPCTVVCVVLTVGDTSSSCDSHNWCGCCDVTCVPSSSVSLLSVFLISEYIFTPFPFVSLSLLPPSPSLPSLPPSRAVVQLFNAVSQQQKAIEAELKEVGPSERKKAKGQLLLFQSLRLHVHVHNYTCTSLHVQSNLQ